MKYGVVWCGVLGIGRCEGKCGKGWCRVVGGSVSDGGVGCGGV